MTSGRRKKGLAPWLVLIGVAVILAGLYVIIAGGGDPTEQAQAAGDGGSPDTPGVVGASVGADRPNQPAPDARPASTPPTGNTPRDAAPQRQTPAPPDTRSGPDAIAAANDPDRQLLRGENKDQYDTGLRLLGSANPAEQVAGRALLSELLFRDGALPRHEAQGVRERLAHENQRMVFSKQIIEGDTITAAHTVQEYLGPIGNRYRVPYQLLERINGITANRLQIGQKLKVLRGPVHARIDKSDYRMDLFVVDPDGLPIYLKSYNVGLGEFDSTPIGLWRIKPGSKVGPDAANGQGPSWRNPRTGQVYDSDDPDIPIGEYWMALEGRDENTQGIEGYGIHATNDPDSIGQQASMGCIRMNDDDIDEVFYTLFEGASTVEIVP